MTSIVGLPRRDWGQFALVMNEATARKAETHIGLYTKKGLITKFETLEELAKWDYWGMFVTEKSLQVPSLSALAVWNTTVDAGVLCSVPHVAIFGALLARVSV
eukprot:869598-Rhodomonas_salina.1